MVVETPKSSVEELLTKLIQANETKLSQLKVGHKTLEASVKNIEIQIGQMQKTFMGRPSGSLPSDTENNPRERVQAITLRSGKQLPSPTIDVKSNEEKAKRRSHRGNQWGYLSPFHQ